jgi:hypothetical protein
MSAEEFDDHWRDYCENPWGPMRDLIHTAMQVQATANYAGKVRKDDIVFKDSVLALSYYMAQLLDPEKYKDPEPDPAAYFSQFKKK